MRKIRILLGKILYILLAKHLPVSYEVVKYIASEN